MDEVTLSLSSNDIGQMLDGLEVLIEQWEATQAYHETGEIRPGTEIREANDAEEAANMAGIYRELADRIRRQLPVHH